jgi:hypothetical protein
MDLHGLDRGQRFAIGAGFPCELRRRTPHACAIVANFENEWEMTSDDIDLALTALDGKAVV